MFDSVYGPSGEMPTGVGVGIDLAGGVLFHVECFRRTDGCGSRGDGAHCHGVLHFLLFRAGIAGAGGIVAEVGHECHVMLGHGVVEVGGGGDFLSVGCPVDEYEA